MRAKSQNFYFNSPLNCVWSLRTKTSKSMNSVWSLRAKIYNTIRKRKPYVLVLSTYKLTVTFLQVHKLSLAICTYFCGGFTLVELSREHATSHSLTVASLAMDGEAASGRGEDRPEIVKNGTLNRQKEIYTAALDRIFGIWYV